MLILFSVAVLLCFCHCLYCMIAISANNQIIIFPSFLFLQRDKFLDMSVVSILFFFFPPLFLFLLYISTFSFLSFISNAKILHRIQKLITPKSLTKTLESVEKLTYSVASMSLFFQKLTATKCYIQSWDIRWAI